MPKGGSLSYKTRSQQALRNKSRVPEQPTLPPRTDRRWEGGGCSQRAGRAAPPMAGAGGEAECVPPTPRRRNTGCPGRPPELSVPGAVGSGGEGLGGGLGSPALRLAGTGGAAGGATCAVPGVLLVVPSVVGEGVPGARGAVGENGVRGGDTEGLRVPSMAWLLSTTSLWLRWELW